MLSSIDIDKTEAIKHSTSIKEISSILLPFKISRFNFSRVYPDGTKISLSNSAEWLKLANERFFKYSLTSKPFSKYENLRLLWSQLGDLEIFRMAKEHSKVGHGFIEFVKKEEYCDIYIYSTDIRNIGFDVFYLNNLDLLQSFQSYFQEKAFKIIKEVQNDRAIFPKSIPDESFNLKSLSYIDDKIITDPEKRKVFFEKINFIDGLTKSEQECLKYLSRGMTAKEIAAILQISPRTVETHIYHMKMKLNCYRKSNLASIFWANKDTQ